MSPRFVGIAVVLLVELTLGAPGKTWQVVAPSDAGFRVLMPDKPKQEDITKEQESGPSRCQSFATEYHDVAFRVAVTTYKPFRNVTTSKQIQSVLDQGRDAAVKEMKGDKVTSQAVTLGSHKGLEFRFEFPTADGLPDGGTYKARVFLVSDRLYQMIVVIPKAKEETEGISIGKFFESFRITGKTAP